MMARAMTSCTLSFQRILGSPSSVLNMRRTSSSVCAASMARPSTASGKTTLRGRLRAADGRVQAYVVESENFESIHNHSAYALIERDKLAG